MYLWNCKAEKEVSLNVYLLLIPILILERGKKRVRFLNCSFGLFADAPFLGFSSKCGRGSLYKTAYRNINNINTINNINFRNIHMPITAKADLMIARIW